MVNNKQKRVSKPKIMLITNFEIPHFGGLSRGLLNQARHLSEKGYEVYIMCKKNPEKPLVSRSYKVITLEGRLQESGFMDMIHDFFLLSWFLYRIANKLEVDVFYAHDVSAALSCILAGQGRKTIFHLHSIASKGAFVFGKDPCSLSPLSKAKVLITSLLISITEIIAYNLVDKIICVSEYEENDAKKKCLQKASIHIVRNGVDTEVFKPSMEKRQFWRRKFSANGKVIVLFLGRMVPKNGPLIIAKAIPIVNSKLENVLFIFVGDGVERQSLEEYIKQNKIENAILLHSISAEEILPAADIFVSHVSSLVPGFGQTIIEAMATGIPTVTGRDEIKEKIFAPDEIVLTDKDNSTNLAYAIILLTVDNKRRSSLSHKGRLKILKELSFSSTLNKIEKIISSYC